MTHTIHSTDKTKVPSELRPISNLNIKKVKQSAIMKVWKLYSSDLTIKKQVSILESVNDSEQKKSNNHKINDVNSLYLRYNKG